MRSVFEEWAVCDDSDGAEGLGPVSDGGLAVVDGDHRHCRCHKSRDRVRGVSFSEGEIVPCSLLVSFPSSCKPSSPVVLDRFVLVLVLVLV